MEQVQRLVVRNLARRTVTVTLFALAEFCLWNAMDDFTNFQRNFSTGEVEVPSPGDARPVIIHKTEYRERRDHVAYFACSGAAAGFDTQREKFLGAYRDWREPIVVEQGESANSIAQGWQPMGSHHLKITLQPGESRTIILR